MGVCCDRLKFYSSPRLPNWPKQRQISWKRVLIPTCLVVHNNWLDDLYSVFIDKWAHPNKFIVELSQAWILWKYFTQHWIETYKLLIFQTVSKIISSSTFNEKLILHCEFRSVVGDAPIFSMKQVAGRSRITSVFHYLGLQMSFYTPTTPTKF